MNASCAESSMARPMWKCIARDLLVVLVLFQGIGTDHWHGISNDSKIYRHLLRPSQSTRYLHPNDVHHHPTNPTTFPTFNKWLNQTTPATLHPLRLDVHPFQKSTNSK
ncbi:hypothetical protein DL95DRAFT_385284 [Leptodontidium sp. 2 PMI_412]|nr:hypothetical protein DL95DRAFT_385284 [Leptodontidium sp. 2 PMI_412]